MSRDAMQGGAAVRLERVDDRGRGEDGRGVDDAGAVGPSGEIAQHEPEAVEQWRDVACGECQSGLLIELWGTRTEDVVGGETHAAANLDAVVEQVVVGELEVWVSEGWTHTKRGERTETAFGAPVVPL